VAVGRICFYSRFSLSWSGLVGFIFLLPVDRFFVAISVWFSSANRVRRPNFSCERRMRDGLWPPFQLSYLEFLAQVAPFLFATEILPVRLVLLGFLSVQVIRSLQFSILFLSHWIHGLSFSRFSSYFNGGFLFMHGTCLIKFVWGSEKSCWSDFGCRSFARGSACTNLCFCCDSNFF
jgi:hypothetical protein